MKKLLRFVTGLGVAVILAAVAGIAEVSGFNPVQCSVDVSHDGYSVTVVNSASTQNPNLQLATDLGDGGTTIFSDDKISDFHSDSLTDVWTMPHSGTFDIEITDTDEYSSQTDCVKFAQVTVP